MEITKIVITGGPCAGKTTAMSWIQNSFTQKGYKVLFVPETATELISGGVCPWTTNTNRDFQLCQCQLQLEKERIFEQAARNMPDERILIVCDRGMLDNKAYMTDEDFAYILRILGRGEVELRDGYDGVFHLVTAAKGAAEFYTTANNAARYETAEEACALDERLLSGWIGHPHLRVIDNATDFEEKMRRLIAEINTLLGEPEPYDRKRKYLIEYPNVLWLESIPGCSRVEIIQTYLRPDGEDLVRVRQRGVPGSYVYYEKRKRLLGGKPVEIEKRLTQEEYLDLLMDADTNRRQLRKTRYCFNLDGQYCEVDLFPFWNDKALLLLEVRGDQPPVFPSGLQVIRDVTDEEAYRNSALTLRN